MIEDYEFCRAVAEGRPFEPGFEQALAVGGGPGRAAALGASGRWEDVAADRADGGRLMDAPRPRSRRCASASSASGGSAACTPSCSARRSPAPRSARVHDAHRRRRATWPTSSACRAAASVEEMLDARRRRGRDLLDRRHPRRPDRRRRRGGQGDLLREAGVARPRRASTARWPPSRPPACRSRSASTGASTRRTRRCARRSPRARSASRTSCASPAATPRRRRSSTSATSGGLFLDMTIHDFDMARFVTGSEVVEVFARGARARRPGVRARPATSTPRWSTLVHANGCLTAIDNSRRAVYGYDQRVEVFGSAGMAASENPLAHTGVVRTAARHAAAAAARTSSSSATCRATCASGRRSSRRVQRGRAAAGVGAGRARAAGDRPGGAGGRCARAVPVRVDEVQRCDEDLRHRRRAASSGSNLAHVFADATAPR